jgi:catechol 2,3-dioxygenase-like lactoylglutathione lyase family enzyme
VAVGLLVLAVLLWPALGIANAADANYHHVHLTVTNGDVAAQWYIDHMGCKAVTTQTDAAQCGDVQLLFIPRPAKGGNEGTAADHISFSVADLAAKIKQLLAVGVAGFGVRIMDRESPIHDEPGLFKTAFAKDPWGTKIELVEDPGRLGFHHVHLVSADPNGTLKWYQNTFGGKPATLKGRLSGLSYGNTWLIISQSTGSGMLQPTQGRTIDHIGFAFSDLKAAETELQKKGVQLRPEATADSATGGESKKAVMIAGPDNILIEAVQP